MRTKHSNTFYYSSRRTMSKVAAILLVALLVGGFTLTAIGALTLLGPSPGHAGQVEHESGIIVSIESGQRFTLQTATGKILRFTRGRECRVSLPHLWRHLHERAHTDVYYLEEPDHQLWALYAD
jgi:hypothetical protein